MPQNSTTKSPEKRFVDIAELRTNKVINALTSLSKCSSRNYKYTDQQVKQMFSALRKSLNDCQSKFESNGRSSNNSFKFK